MIERITYFFLHRYADRPVEIREKAKLFLYLILSTFAFLFILFFVCKYALNLHMTTYVILAYGMGLTVSIVILRTGNYHLAVNFFSMLFAAGIIFLTFYGQIGRERNDYITNIYYFPIIIIFTALFCSPSWIVVITLVLIASGTVSFVLFTRAPTDAAFFSVAQGAFIDSTGAIVFSFIICFTIIMLNRRITRTRRQEERTKELNAELEIARLIQSNLLPAGLAEDPRISIYPNYIPMEEIGGDFYDFFTSGDEIHVFIADVSGHGIPGAFMALITKVALLHAIPDSGSTTEVVKKINDVLCGCTVLGNFVSCFYCRINKSSKQIRYTSAGHFPQFLYRRRDDSFRELYTRGTVMGWNRRIELNEESVDLESGDRLVLFTDGVTECMNAKGEMFAEERLKSLIAKSAALTAQGLSIQIIRSLVDFITPEPFHDDLTLITIDIN
jgi:hypothetical protein